MAKAATTAAPPATRNELATLGAELFNKGKAKEAYATWQRALEARPSGTDPEPWLLEQLATLAEELKLPREAIRYHEACVKKLYYFAPERGIAMRKLGEGYAAAGDRKRAVKFAKAGRKFWTEEMPRRNKAELVLLEKLLGKLGVAGEPLAKAAKPKAEPKPATKKLRPQARGGAPRSVKEAWQRIVAWLEQHAPALASRLRGPARAADIAKAERRLGLVLPRDLRESFACHDGDGESGVIGGWYLMSLDHCCREAKLMRRLVDEGAFAGATAAPHARITSEWWSKRWVPIVSSGSGHSLCVDLAPQPGGHVGQVILFFHDDEKRLLVAESVADWLSTIALDLERGVYAYDLEDSFDGQAFLWSSLEGKDTYGPRR
jgi:cell wall assembly regulator SMI1